MERSITDIKIPKKEEFVLEGPKKGETELERERRLLMNAYKSGRNVDTLRRMEDEAARQKDEQQALEGKEILEGQSRTRVIGSPHVTPEDLKPSAYTGSAEDVVANEESFTQGEGYEKRKDFDLRKEGEADE